MLLTLMQVKLNIQCKIELQPLIRTADFLTTKEEGLHDSQCSS